MSKSQWNYPRKAEKLGRTLVPRLELENEMGAKILTQAQAEAAFGAMHAVKAVGGRVALLMPNGGGRAVRVSELDTGYVRVIGEHLDAPSRAENKEVYESRVQFGFAYGLFPGRKLTEAPAKGVDYWMSTNTGHWLHTWSDNEEDRAALREGRAFATPYA